MDKKTLGKQGEEMARAFLRKHRYRVLAANVRTRHGEIDIIARRRRRLVFIEVKTRTGTGFGLPAESVTARKLGHLERSAEAWMQKEGLVEDYAFEVLSILWGEGEPSFELIPVE